MKKMFAILVSVYLAFAWQSPIYAQEEKEIWLTYIKQGSALTVEIQSDGNVADGLSQINYPAYVTFVKAEKSNGIAMSAVNGEAKGEVKLSYLAEETIPKGTMYTLVFQIDEDHVNDAISFIFKNQIHNTEGNVLPSNDGVIEIPKEDTSKPSTPDPKPNPDQGEDETTPKGDGENPASKEETPTGDVNNIAALSVCFGGAGALLIAYKRKHG